MCVCCPCWAMFILKPEMASAEERSTRYTSAFRPMSRIAYFIVVLSMILYTYTKSISAHGSARASAMVYTMPYMPPTTRGRCDRRGRKATTVVPTRPLLANPIVRRHNPSSSLWFPLSHELGKLLLLGCFSEFSGRPWRKMLHLHEWPRLKSQVPHNVDGSENTLHPTAINRQRILSLACQ